MFHDVTHILQHIGVFFGMCNKCLFVAIGTVGSGNAWMGEVGNKQSRTGEKECLFWQDPPSVRKPQASSVCRKTPAVSTHTQESGRCPISEVRGRGNQTFVCSLRNSALARSVRGSGAPKQKSLKVPLTCLLQRKCFINRALQEESGEMWPKAQFGSRTDRSIQECEGNNSFSSSREAEEGNRRDIDRFQTKGEGDKCIVNELNNLGIVHF